MEKNGPNGAKCINHFTFHTTDTWVNPEPPKEPEPGQPRERRVKKIITTTTYDFRRMEGPPPPCLRRPCPRPCPNKIQKVDKTALPYRLPTEAKNHEKVNNLLQYFGEQQREYDLSDKNLFLVVILDKCLKALNVASNIVFGYRTITGPKSLPHIWLQVQGYNIDSIVLAKRTLCPGSLNFLVENYCKCYNVVDEYRYGIEDGPHPAKLDNDLDQQEDYISKKQIWFIRAYPDHALALGLNRPKASNFFFAMIRYVYDTHKLSVQGIDPSVRYQCWGCFKYPKAGWPIFSHMIDEDSPDSSCDDFVDMPSKSKKFPQCPRCSVANYCSRKCQEEDWKNGHCHSCNPSTGDLPILPEDLTSATIIKD